MLVSDSHMNVSSIRRTISRSLSAAVMSACAYAQPVKLDGSAARGGAKNKEGDSVYLTAAMGTAEEVRWDFAEPLAAGAWRLTVDFNGKVGGVKCQTVGFIADRTSHISCRRGRQRSQANKVAEPSRLRADKTVRAPRATRVHFCNPVADTKS